MDDSLVDERLGTGIFTVALNESKSKNSKQSDRNFVKLIRMPGHTAIEGNEKVHELARIGFATPRTLGQSL